MKEKIKKIYSSGGVLLILKTKEGEEHLVLVKRTDNAEPNPGSHSGFFGWADSEEEYSCAASIAYRELLEEFLVVSRNDKKVYNLVFEQGKNSTKNLKKSKDCTRELIKLWKKEKGLKIKKNIPIEPIKGKIVEKVEFIESGGRKEVFILEFDLKKLDLSELHILDGETEKEFPNPENLLDREIDVFNLREFKKWWYDDNRSTLGAEISFKTAKEEAMKGFIDKKSKDRISPSLVLVLNKWLGVDC